MKILVIGHIVGTASSRPDAALVLGLRKEGIEIDAAIPAGSYYTDIFIKEGIRVFHPDLSHKISRGAVKNIRRLIRERKYDIIHLLNTHAITNGVIAAACTPAKIVAYRGAAGTYWYDPTAWIAHLNPAIDVLVCNSSYVLGHMRKHLLFNPDKAVLIHKGMDAEWFENVKPLSRESLGIAEDSLILGCTANFRKVKGIRYLLEATRYLDPRLPVHILLMGSGMAKAGIQNHAAAGYDKKIHFLGYRKDIYEVIAACDIYVQPSLSESLSRSVMEAMCLGVPCIVSDAGGLRELSDNGRCAVMTGKGDAKALAQAIEKLAADKTLRKQYADMAKERMRNVFSVSGMVKQTRQLYERMLS